MYKVTYKKILLCLDNSAQSTTAIDFALTISSATGAVVTGCHVYAAKLHDARFAEMESGLPERYQNPEELERQRTIHDDLITKGLLAISDSYMSVLINRAKEFDAGKGIATEAAHLEGRNFEEILKAGRDGGYDLITLGALGLGATARCKTGSVARRVVRMAKSDVLVVRDTDFPDTKSRGKITVAIDGSPRSFGALRTALALSKIYSCDTEAVAAFDPQFHYTAFRSIAGVLSEEASKLFRFKEQEKLHKEIIDGGLEKIYQGHLDTAVAVADADGVKITTVLLSGKATDKIIEHVDRTKSFMLVVGRTGLHATGGLDIGNVTEECLSSAGCNLLVSSKEFTPAQRATASNDSLDAPAWSGEAEEILNKIPSFARAIARNMIEKSAIEEGLSEIDADFMYKIKKRTGL
jgi:nucleotide-binding universal stress UspA family protein